ncbi:MAG: RES family NAD+ phosphorylase [Chitinophagaceae bacterium]|nr:RES family NAD+ phosphorylase [Chitinophagaceae bacterium]
MLVYRMVKNKARTLDLSGMGPFLGGGRWNFEGIYAVYTAAYRSLALLETLVHLEEDELPNELYIIAIEVADNAPILTFTIEELPASWRELENYAIRQIGTEMLNTNQYIALKVPSAVMPFEHNYVLNPQYPGFEGLVKIKAIEKYEPDERLSPKPGPEPGTLST